MIADTVFDIGNGLLMAKHPVLGCLVRSDGAVFNRKKGNWYEYDWTYGSVNKNDGYCTVMIDHRPYKVHVLVAETFIYNPDPEHKTTVDHADQNRTNNSVDNLSWASHSEQRYNSSQTQLHRNKYGVSKKEVGLSEYNRIMHKAYNEEHKAEISEKAKARYEANLEKRRAKMREYYYKNKERILANQKEKRK